MDRAEIPPRFQSAHLLRNCGAWSDDPDRAEAYAVALAFADRGLVEERGRDRYALFLTGEFGRGKTWLASAVFKNLLAKSKTRAGMWRMFHWFIREVQATYHSSSSTRSDQVIRSYQKTPLLMLDDVGDLDRARESEDRTRLLYEVLDYRNNYLLPTIITTNLLPAEMEAQFGARTFQRVLEMSAFVEMGGANLREVAA
jgi:DNA replication protein DnaC